MQLYFYQPITNSRLGQHVARRRRVGLDLLAELADVDAQGDGELDDALHAARSRVGARGRVVVEGANCVCCDGLKSICDRARAVGLDVISFDHIARRLVLGARPPLAMAA